MKKIIYIIIFFISSFGVSQPLSIVAVVNQNVFLIINPTSNPTTNDFGLNQIVNQNNAYFVEIGASVCDNTYSSIIIDYNEPATNVNQLISNLNSYSNVVSAYKYNLINAPIKQELQNETIGSFTGIVNGIVVTNNTELNSLFQQYDVTSWDIGNYISCTGNIDQLFSELSNLNSIILNVSICSVAFLSNSNDNFENQKTKISPNPFSTTFEVNAKEIISNYEVYDLIGKQIITANSKEALNSKTETLKSGVYLLELTFENGKTNTIKLIKN